MACTNIEAIYLASESGTEDNDNDECGSELCSKEVNAFCCSFCTLKIWLGIKP
ncbi:MAG: hypothetical protein ACHQ1D_02075 [Nitrososphaerales archaeon]